MSIQRPATHGGLLIADDEGHEIAYPFEMLMLHPDRLEQPLHWRGPRVVFVASRGDLFHDAVSDEFRDQVFSIILAREMLTRFTGHKPIASDIWLMLTKRAERLRSYLSPGPEVLLPRWAEAGDKLVDMRVMWRVQFGASVKCGVSSFAEYVHARCAYRRNADGLCVDMRTKPWKHTEQYWPLPNVWLGVSVTSQADADERIPLLLDTPAAHRWVSCEPLLGEIDPGMIPSACLTDWWVIGAESGPGRRPALGTWFDLLRKRFRTAGIRHNVKQQCLHRVAEVPQEDGTGKLVHFPPTESDIPADIWAMLKGKR
jgi:protein gp37